MPSKLIKSVSCWLCIFVWGVGISSQAHCANLEIILDASGSMASSLPGGQSKLDAAKAALAELARGLDPGLNAALRVYGHQSPTAKKDCQDTALLVPFSPAAQSGPEMLAGLGRITAKGYTPITYVLGLAARDFPPDAPGERVIVLLSDGKETCEGDPCATAAALAKADANLVIHVIGFDVDAGAKKQLDCLARAGRGRYYNAPDTASLAKSLKQALEPAPLESKTRTISLPKSGPGYILLQGAEVAGNPVINAETGQTVGELSHVKSKLEVPAGIYNVGLGNARIKSVEVKAGETTELNPARLSVTGATLHGQAIIDPETREEAARVSNSKATALLIPGRYLVLFGKAEWPVELGEGQKLTLNPGVVSAKGLDMNGLAILDKNGNEIGNISQSASSMPLPPGDYVLAFPGRKIEFSLQEGERLEFK